MFGPVGQPVPGARLRYRWLVSVDGVTLGRASGVLDTDVDGECLQVWTMDSAPLRAADEMYEVELGLTAVHRARSS